MILWVQQADENGTVNLFGAGHGAAVPWAELLSVGAVVGLDHRTQWRAAVNGAHGPFEVSAERFPFFRPWFGLFSVAMIRSGYLRFEIVVAPRV